MQEPKSEIQNATWLRLSTKKSVMFLLHLFGKKLLVKPLLILNDEYLTLAELRDRGVTKIESELVFYNIVECAYLDSNALHRLTPLGMELKQKLQALFDVSERMFNGQNFSENIGNTKKATGKSLI